MCFLFSLFSFMGRVESVFFSSRHVQLLLGVRCFLTEGVRICSMLPSSAVDFFFPSLSVEHSVFCDGSMEGSGTIFALPGPHAGVGVCRGRRMFVHVFSFP